MIFTKAQLQAMIEGKAAGPFFPYKGGNEKEIEAYLQQLLIQLNESERLACDGEFSNYGSGYASFVEFFCVKKDGSSLLSKGEIPEDNVRTEELEGISVYVSRLAPVAVFGWSERTKMIQEQDGMIIDEGYSGFAFLHPDTIGTIPPRYSEELTEIKEKLSKAGCTMLGKQAVEATLPFEADIPTILTLPGFRDGEAYTIFDAIFYWED